MFFCLVEQNYTFDFEEEKENMDIFHPPTPIICEKNGQKSD